MINKIRDKFNSYVYLVFSILTAEEVLNLYFSIYFYICGVAFLTADSNVFLLLNSFRESFMNLNFNVENKDQELITE